jgi:hypothetical protein
MTKLMGKYRDYPGWHKVFTATGGFCKRCRFLKTELMSCRVGNEIDFEEERRIEHPPGDTEWSDGSHMNCSGGSYAYDEVYGTMNPHFKCEDRKRLNKAS